MLDAPKGAGADAGSDGGVLLFFTASCDVGMRWQRKTANYQPCPLFCLLGAFPICFPKDNGR
jgi:hypothetical protein